MELGLTQEELAERVGEGVRQSEISRLEHGRVTLPRRHRLEQIAAALDVSMGDLMVRTGWMDEENRAAVSAESEDTAGAGARDPEAIGAPSLQAAADAVADAQELVAQSADALDAAEQALATAMDSLSMKPNPRGSVTPKVGVVSDWESTMAFPA